MAEIASTHLAGEERCWRFLHFLMLVNASFRLRPTHIH
jgi:hypothetical protein